MWNSICNFNSYKKYYAGKNIKTAARILLGAGLIFAGVGHLSFARKEFRAQVPDWVPLTKDDTVVYSGFVEIAMGSALIFTNKKHKKTIGRVAAAFFTAVFPWKCFSICSINRSAFGLNTDKKRFIRLLFQPVLIYWALKSTD